VSHTDLIAGYQRAFTKKETPLFLDKFWEVKEKLDTYNVHMASTFKPSFITCLDKFMPIWSNKWTFSGWMFVPSRKSHQFGNEYHEMCCGLFGIFFHWKLLKEKINPKNIVKMHWIDLGENVESCYSYATFVIFYRRLLLMKGNVTSFSNPKHDRFKTTRAFVLSMLSASRAQSYVLHT